MKNKTGWKLWVGLLISALFLYISFRGVDIVKTWKEICSVNPFYILIVIALMFFQFIVRAWRWDILMEPIKKTGFRNRLGAVLIGFAANCIFPARLGEFIRANFIGQKEQISASAAFGTIVIERLFDGFTLLLVLVIGVIGTTFPEEWISVSGKLKGTGISIFGFYLLLIAVLIGFKYNAEALLKIINNVFFFIPETIRSKLTDMAMNFAKGLVMSKKPEKWLLTIFFSFLVWFIALLQIEMIEQSIGASLPFITTFLLLTMSSFGAMIPSAPGYVGTFHLAAQYGFIFYGLGKEEALSAAIIWHASMIFPTILFGLAALLAFNVSPSRLSEEPVTIE